MIAETVVPKKGVGSPKAGSSKSGSPKAGKPKKRAGKPNVSKAVRVVLRRVGIEATRENENILRVVTYKVMKKPWPPGMKRLLGGLPTGEPITEMVAPELVVATAPEPEIAVDEDADDYIDADLRAELLEEERREEQRRIAEEQDCADRERRFEIERRLVTQMNAARGQDPDADEGYVGD